MNSINLIVLVSTAVGFLAGAGAMWLRPRIRRQIDHDRARLNEHLRRRGGKNVVGGPRWGGFPPTDG